MKRVSICTLALLSIVVLVLVQGCNSKPAVNITGKWVEVDGPDTVEFKTDGSFTGNFVYDADGFQKLIAGKYSADGAKITLTASDDPKASMVWSVADSNGILTVTYKQGGLAKLDGSTAKFHRSN
jgi:hypothetical protein